METKKSKKASLENKRGLFLEIGLVLSLAIVLGALEWSSKPRTITDLTSGVELEDYMIEIPNTFAENKPKVVAPPPVAIDFVMVDDEIEIDDELELIELEGNIDELYDIIPWVEEDNIDDDIFTVVETMPKFMGGEKEAFWKYVMKHLSYPEQAAEMDIEGVVLVQFVVNKSGEIANLKVIRSADALLTNEVKRVFASCPEWEPGKQRDKPVNVMFTMPFKFQLN